VDSVQANCVFFLFFFFFLMLSVFSHFVGPTSADAVGLQFQK
jgi:hypothetical protein